MADGFARAGVSAPMSWPTSARYYPAVDGQIGRPFKMPFEWHGDLPSIGDYLASSPGRARFAYRVLSADGFEAHVGVLDAVRTGTFTVQRIAFEHLPPGALVSRIEWSKRGRKSR